MEDLELVRRTDRIQRPSDGGPAIADSAPPDPASKRVPGRAGQRSLDRPKGSAAIRASDPRMSPDEELLVVLRGIGASMLLTSQRLVLARDGVDRRPRTGLQSYGLDEIRHLRIEMGSAPSGRIAVWTNGSDQEALSMFFDGRSLERAHELIDVARPLVARQRRERPGGPVRSPIGPARPGFPRPSEPNEPPARS